MMQLQSHDDGFKHVLNPYTASTCIVWNTFRQSRTKDCVTTGESRRASSDGIKLRPAKPATRGATNKQEKASQDT